MYNIQSTSLNSYSEGQGQRGIVSFPPSHPPSITSAHCRSSFSQLAADRCVSGLRLRAGGGSFENGPQIRSRRAGGRRRQVTLRNQTQPLWTPIMHLKSTTLMTPTRLPGVRFLRAALQRGSPPGLRHAARWQKPERLGGGAAGDECGGGAGGGEAEGDGEVRTRDVSEQR